MPLEWLCILGLLVTATHFTGIQGEPFSYQPCTVYSTISQPLSLMVKKHNYVHVDIVLYTAGIIMMLLFLSFSGQSCLESIGNIDIPNINKSQYRQLNSIRPGRYQAIVPSYRFNCSGNITEWTIAVTQLNMYDFDLQVWRPSPIGDNTRHYVLIGQNSFYRNASNYPTQNGSKWGVIQVSPPLPENQLQVEPGDVLGIYVFSYPPQGSGIVLLSSRRYRSQRGEEVWYTRVGKQAVVGGGQECPARPETTILDTFINAIPAISVAVNITTDNGRTVYTLQYNNIARIKQGIVGMVISIDLQISQQHLLLQ